jgi:hypothetical protein
MRIRLHWRLGLGGTNATSVRTAVLGTPVPSFQIQAANETTAQATLKEVSENMYYLRIKSFGSTLVF